MRDMNSWDDTWGQIRWFDKYDDFDSYKAHSDAEVIRKIKNFYHASVDFNMADKGAAGMTPLHYAAKFRSVKVAEALVDGGADMCIADEKGRTPLHYAAEVGDLAMARYLVEHGPKNYEKIKDRDGKTAAQYAALNGYERVVRFLDNPSNPKAAKECGKVEWLGRKEKKELIILSILAVLAVCWSRSVVAKQIEKAEKKEKSKIELKTENAQANVKQKAVEDKKPEPKTIRISEPVINPGNSMGRMRTIDGSHLGNDLSSDTRYLHTYNRPRER